MSAFTIQITKGCLETDIDKENKDSFEVLKKLTALEEIDGLWRLGSLYRAGRLYMGKDGRGFIEASKKELKDLLVEPDDLSDAKRDDIVVAKRIIARRGRASAKIVAVLEKAHIYTIAYSHIDKTGNFELLNIRTNEPTAGVMDGVSLDMFKIGTVFRINVDDDRVIESLGHLDDARVDEKISLALYNRYDEFPVECTSEAIKTDKTVVKDKYKDRVDLTHLDFCTIDPITAKDFDDAIYFDTKSCTLYVAIADVSHYVPFFSDIDLEAKRRAFTTYLPHKSFPMLPRQLSENICSLKPKVDRLAFVAKIELDSDTLKPIKEEFFEAIIHSQHRFNYEAVDSIIENNGTGYSDKIADIIEYLLPLYSITQRLREARLKNGFDFHSEEVRLSINEEHELVDTNTETSTASHSLVEECMLLANQASAKRFEGNGDSIFRIHEPPQLSRTETLLSELASIGLYVEKYKDSPSLIRAIQAQAKQMGLSSEVDTMIIKSLRQASYSAFNVGHFGLGFSHYSHFTSPIRRYADLILHRLIKAQLADNRDELEYLLRNIESLSVKVSELERESTKAEWDFRDRKLARWAKKQIGGFFDAEITEAGENTKAVLLGDIKGVTVNIKGDGLMLFDKVRIMITEVDIAQATIVGELVLKLDNEPMSL